jgi:hypothetical protein
MRPQKRLGPRISNESWLIVLKWWWQKPYYREDFITILISDRKLSSSSKAAWPETLGGCDWLRHLKICNVAKVLLVKHRIMICEKTHWYCFNFEKKNIPKLSTFLWFQGQLQLYLAQLQIPGQNTLNFIHNDITMSHALGRWLYTKYNTARSVVNSLRSRWVEELLRPVLTNYIVISNNCWW